MCKTEVPVRAGVSHKIETENRPTNVREPIVGGAEGLHTVRGLNLEMLGRGGARHNPVISPLALREQKSASRYATFNSRVAKASKAVHQSRTDSQSYSN